MAVSFIVGGNRCTRRKPPTCCKSLTNFITKCCIGYTSPWTGFELTTSVVISTDCTGSCTSNYHTIKTTTAPVTRRLSYKKQELFTVRKYLGSPPVFSWGPCCSLFWLSVLWFSVLFFFVLYLISNITCPFLICTSGFLWRLFNIVLFYISDRLLIKTIWTTT